MELDKSKYAAAYQSEIERQFTPQETALIWDQARSGYQKLLAAYPDLPPKVAAHTDGVIFPAIAVYRALAGKRPERAWRSWSRAWPAGRQGGQDICKACVAAGYEGRLSEAVLKGCESGFGEKSALGRNF